MELLKQLIPILITLSLGLLIVSCAMASSYGQFAYVLRRPALLIRAVIAIDVIPLAAALLVLSFAPGIPYAAKAAILLMAISPVPPLVPGKALKFGGRPDYVYGLQNAMPLLALVTVPLLGLVVDSFYGSAALFPLSVVATNVALGLVLPLLIGIALGRWIAPDFSRRAAPVVAKLGMALVVIAFVPVIIGSWGAMMTLIGDGTLVAMAVVIAVAIAGGHLIGGEQPEDRATLAFASATRHPGIALALAGANHADPTVSAGVLLFLLVGLVAMIPYQLAIKKRLAAKG